MRYGILSDIHANLEALEAVLLACEKENIGQYLCTGDVVGYAANPNECVDKLKELAAISIAGNHDRAAVDLFSLDYFTPAARDALIWTSKNLNSSSRVYLESLELLYKNSDLTLAHAGLDSPEDFNYIFSQDDAWKTFSLLENNICFIGHTHRPGVFIRNYLDSIYYKEESVFEIKSTNKYIVNVGSIGQPRDGNSRAAYCIYDTEKKQVEIKRLGYDIELTRKKIISSGLPQELGDRLIAGK